MIKLENLWTLIYATASVAIISLLSLVGVLILSFRKQLQGSTLQFLVSFSVGGLFGGAFFHLIPEASRTGYTQDISIYILLGVFTAFTVERFLMWRHTHEMSTEEHPRSFAYMNLYGDAVHNLIDGLVIGGAYLYSHSLGVTTTLAVFMHELPQEIGDISVLLYAGFDKRKALLYNFVTSLSAFLGLILSIILSTHISQFTAILLPFSAGNFIYIAGSDLVPELQKEEKNRYTIIQITGIFLGLYLLFLFR